MSNAAETPKVASEKSWSYRHSDGPEIRVADVKALKQLARGKRIHDDDYIYNPHLKSWMYASDVAELKSILTARRRAPLLFLFAFGFLTFGVSLLFAPVIYVVAIACGVMAVASGVFSFIHS